MTLDPLTLDLSGRQLVEASAGTGKTWTLSALALRLLLERGLEPRQLLVLTFTRAATAELQQRIRDRLALVQQRLRSGVDSGDALIEGLLARLAALGIDEVTVRRRVAAALAGYDEASISTIHGWCQRALAELPFTAGAPLALELVEDEAPLRLQFVHDHWHSALQRATAPLSDTAAAQLAAMLLDRKDSPAVWERAFEGVLQQPLTRLVWPEAMQVSDGAEDCNTAETDAMAQTLQQQFDDARTLWAASRQAICDVIDEARERLHQGYYKPELVDRAITDWDRFLAADSPLAAAGLVKKTKLDLLTTRRLRPKKNLAPPHPHPFFDQAEQLLETLVLARREDSPLALQRLALLRDLLEAGPARFAAAKRQARQQSYGDMLAEVHRALRGPRGAIFAAALRRRWPAALIDEFQDTDALQAEIFDAVYGAHPECPLLLLGDPKQAIYAFRGADLASYLRESQRAKARHALADNQRSTPQLIAALNVLFAGHRRAFVLQGLDYQPVAAGAKPRAALADPSGLLGAAALQLWWLPRDALGQPLTKTAARQAAAEATAERIARLLSAASPVTLDRRAIGGGDIAVLVRTHREGALMRRALASRGVASVELSRHSVHASAEAAELETVLGAIADPTHTTRLHAALATTLAGHDATSLAALQQDPPAQQQLVESFLQRQQEWRRRGIGSMLRRWIAEGVSARLLARPDGARALTNLLHLAERLQQRQQQAPGTPASLLRWMQAERRRGGNGAEAAQLRLESDRELVQVVTLHAAKGLEYPFVFLPFAWDCAPPRERRLGLAYHDAEDHAVLDFRSHDKDAPERLMHRLEQRSETMRLLYVGLTRAVHRVWVGVGLCGQGQKLNTTEARRSALNSLAAGGERTPEEWLAHALDDAAIEAAWRETAARGAPHIALLPWPERDAAAHYRADQPTTQELAALPGPRQIAPAWMLASYSSLWRDGRDLRDGGQDHPDRAAADHDEAGESVTPDVADDESLAAAPPLAADDFLHFPRGAAAGVCLHEIFERISFADPAGWPAVVTSVLQRHRLGAAADGAPLEGMVLDMLGAVLAAPLPGAAPLAAAARGRCLTELEFCLAAPGGAHGAGREAPRVGQGVDLVALARLMRSAGLDCPALTCTRLDGYLRGFVDLVFEHEGRWHIVDWKSNHLGAERAAYEGAALREVMAAEGYRLQALLYAVALHRWLGRRVVGYRAESHFGGVHYLFLRGMRAEWPGAGIHSWRPEAAWLDAVSGLFGAGARS